MKKKKKTAPPRPSSDCANCGAPEGKVYGVTVHRPSKCGITYYCSVICQKHHWKEGGHTSTAGEGGAQRIIIIGGGRVAEEEQSGPSGARSSAKAKEITRQGWRAIGSKTSTIPSSASQISSARTATGRAEELRNRACSRRVRCRAKLPDSAEDVRRRMHDTPTERRGAERWIMGPPSRRQQRQMDEVVAVRGRGAGTRRLSVIWWHVRGWPGVDVNYKKAAYWFEKAAEQGHVLAQ